jgi:hypothetical protein
MARTLNPETSLRHRTVPLQGTITQIPGYPKKLVIFRIAASSYWWVRYYSDRKIYKRTTKTEIRRDALEAAKRFYDDLNRRLADPSFEGLPREKNAAEVFTFARVTRLLTEGEESKVGRGQLSKISFDNMVLRFNKHILPYFKETDVRSINYGVLDTFLQHLSKQEEPKLGVSTIAAYMGLTRKVLQHAARLGHIDHIPEFPRVGVEDKPRGWFNIAEYKALYRTAKRLAGKKVEWRMHADESKGSYFCLPGEHQSVEDRIVKKITIDRDLSDLIVFMVNSYIRPTDIKNMQHGHVQVVDRQWSYLRLALPPSKGHSYPITTMPWAVKVYQRICRRRLKHLPANATLPPTEYVFMPSSGSRDAALKSLQRQFEVVVEMSGVNPKSPSGELRTLYSLRHTSIMFRLLYGQAIDTLTLARNARTSPEMIDRFYAAPLQGEMNIGLLQAKRNPRPWEAQPRKRAKAEDEAPQA